MAEITKELFERFNHRFPESMTLKDIENELERMKPEEAEKYDTILCNNLFNGFCWNYLKFTRKDLEFIVGTVEYRIFKRRASNLSRHIFYDAWCAFLEGRKKDVKLFIHEYMQTFVNEMPPYGESYHQRNARCCVL